MRFERLLGSALLTVLFAAGAAFSAAGCGSGESAATAQVSPEFRQETNDMLKQMQKDAIAKYQKKAAGKR